MIRMIVSSPFRSIEDIRSALAVEDIVATLAGHHHVGVDPSPS